MEKSLRPAAANVSSTKRLQISGIDESLIEILNNDSIR